MVTGIPRLETERSFQVGWEKKSSDGHLDGLLRVPWMIIGKERKREALVV